MRYMDDDMNDYFLELEAELTYRANHMRIEREIELAKQIGSKYLKNKAKGELKDLMEKKGNLLEYTYFAQRVLVGLGYVLPNYGVDGAYSVDGETYNAIKEFQKDCMEEWDDMLNAPIGTYNYDELVSKMYLSDIEYADGALNPETLKALFKKNCEDNSLYSFENYESLKNYILYGEEEDKTDGYAEKLLISLSKEINEFLVFDDGPSIEDISGYITQGRIDELIILNKGENSKQLEALAKVYEYTTTNEMIIESIILNESFRSKDGLHVPRNPHIFFFEGAGDVGIGDTRKGIKTMHKNGRFNAMCVVVEHGEVTFLTTRASTLPDDPQAQVGAGKGHATVLPGVYHIRAGGSGRNGRHIGFNTGVAPYPDRTKNGGASSYIPVYRAYNNDGNKDPRVYLRNDPASASGCDIHKGWSYPKYNSSTGCITIYGRDKDGNNTNYINFLKAVGLNVGQNDSTLMKDVLPDGTFPIITGIMIIDRTLADRSVLKPMYNNSDAEVDLITEENDYWKTSDYWEPVYDN
jgi:hypothetical protein